MKEENKIARIVIPKALREEREKREEDCQYWLRYYFESYFFKEFSHDQISWINDIVQARSRSIRKCIGAPRGQGKSSIARGVMLYLIMTGKIRYGIIICASGMHSRSGIRNIKSMILSSDRFMKDYREVSSFIEACEGSARKAIGLYYNGKISEFAWSSDRIQFHKIPECGFNGGLIDCGSMTASVRGRNSVVGGESVRPQIVLIDDPQTSESAKSVERVNDTLNFIENDLDGLKGAGEVFSMVSLVTVIRQGDAADTMLSDPRWNGSRCKMLPKMNVDTVIFNRYRQLYEEELSAGRLDSNGISPAMNAFWLANADELSEGWSVCSDNLHIGRGGFKICESSLQYAIGKYLDNPSAFNSEYQNQPELKTGSRGIFGLSPRDVMSHARLDMPYKKLPSRDDIVSISLGIDIGVYECHCVLMCMYDVNKYHVIDYFKVATEADVSSGDISKSGSISRRNLRNAIPYVFDNSIDRCMEICDNIDSVMVDIGSFTQELKDVIKAYDKFKIIGIRGRNSARTPAHNTDRITLSRSRIYWSERYTDETRRMQLDFYHNVDRQKHKIHNNFIDENGYISLFSGKNHWEFAGHICSEELYDTQTDLRWKVRDEKSSNHYFDAMILSMTGIDIDCDRKRKMQSVNVQLDTANSSNSDYGMRNYDIE